MNELKAEETGNSEAVGVFLCTCGNSQNIDFKNIAKGIEKKENVAGVEIVEHLCCDEGAAYIVDDFRRKKLKKVFIAACSSHDLFFRNVASSLGLDESSDLNIVNIRELSGWVHDDKKAATEKARVLIEAGFSRRKYSPALHAIEGSNNILLIGGLSAVRLAQDLKKLGMNVSLLTGQKYIKKACELCIHSQLCSPHSRECLYQSDFPVHSSAEVKSIKGTLGKLEVEIEKKKHIDMSTCIECNQCIETCPVKAIAKASDAVSPAYVIGELCNDCKKCLAVCPTKAIKLESKPEKITASQIISFEKIPAKASEGVYFVDSADNASALEVYKNAQAAALRALLYVKSLQKEKYIDSKPELCSNHRIFGKKISAKGCTSCKEACAYGAIESGRIDHALCRECGACIGVCPQGVMYWTEHIQHELFDDIELMLKADISPKTLLFACSDCGSATVYAAGVNRIKYPAVLPLIVSCLGSVSENHLLRAFELGADSVILAGCNAGKCSNKTGFKNAGKKISFIKDVLKAFNIEEERVKILSANPEKPEEFASAIKQAETAVKKLGSTKLKKKEPIKKEEVVEEKGRREVNLALFKSFSEKLGITKGLVQGDYSFGDAKIDEELCTLCGACGSVCATGAIKSVSSEKNEEGWLQRIIFTHSYCTACRICEELCPDKAITLEQRIDLERFIRKSEHEVGVKTVECERCGMPIMSERGFNKLYANLQKDGLPMSKLCRDCRDRLVIASSLGLDSEEIRIFEQGKRRI